MALLRGVRPPKKPQRIKKDTKVSDRIVPIDIQIASESLMVVFTTTVRPIQVVLDALTPI
jgi:hypothetical protein